MKNKERKSGFKRFLRYILLDIVIAAVVSIVFITYVASAYKIEGNSMQTALNDQERIIIAKLGVKGNIDRCDIVVLRNPYEPGKSIIKRIIGLPGETIEIRQGDVYIDNRKLPEPYLKMGKYALFGAGDMKPLLIPGKHYFVFGDNRPISQDSRFFGPIPEEYIYGKTIFRYWPISRFGKVE